MCLLLAFVALAGVRADVPAVQISGPESVAPFTLVKLRAANLPAGASGIWRVAPKTIDRATTSPDRLEFTGKPGVYEITLLVVVKAGDGIALSEVEHTVTIRESDAPTAPKPRPKIGSKDNAKGSLLRIQVANLGCTATVCGPRHADGRYDLLSAGHCCTAVGDKGKAWLPDGRTAAFTIVARDARIDLSWLRFDVDLGEMPAVTLADAVPPVGTAIWQAGFGLDRPGVIKSGEVSGGVTPDGKLTMTLSVSSGDSGGGVFREDSGELVAAVCCTVERGVKATMYGGSSTLAIKLRPAAVSQWQPVTLPIRSP